MHREVRLDEEKAITWGGETYECHTGVAEELAYAAFALTEAAQRSRSQRRVERGVLSQEELGTPHTSLGGALWGKNIDNEQRNPSLNGQEGDPNTWLGR